MDHKISGHAKANYKMVVISFHVVVHLSKANKCPIISKRINHTFDSMFDTQVANTIYLQLSNLQWVVMK